MIGAGVNVALSASKAVVGAACGSRVLVADAAHSFSDLVLVLFEHQQMQQARRSVVASLGLASAFADAADARQWLGLWCSACTAAVVRDRSVF